MSYESPKIESRESVQGHLGGSKGHGHGGPGGISKH